MKAPTPLEIHVNGEKDSRRDQKAHNLGIFFCPRSICIHSMHTQPYLCKQKTCVHRCTDTQTFREAAKQACDLQWKCVLV